MRLFVLVCGVLLLLGCAGSGVKVAPAERGSSPAPEVRVIYYYPDAPKVVNKEKILRLVNLARSQGRYCGSRYYPPAPPVRWNATLERAAKIHAEDMSRHDFLSHRGSDGSDVGDRLDRLGYNWKICGENVAKGYSTEEEVVEGWLKSPGHCANVMDPRFKEMGVATSGKYWVQVFAAPLK